MDQLPPAARVHTAGREDLSTYRHLIVTSTEAGHGRPLEEIIHSAVDKYLRVHETYVDFLKRGGTPGRENRSSRWRERNDGWLAVLEALAAAMGVLYPKTDRALPLTETHDLITYRIAAQYGPLCSGWYDADGSLTHHPQQPCARHSRPRDARARHRR